MTVFDRKRAAMTKAAAEPRRRAAIYVPLAGAIIAGAALLLYPRLSGDPASTKNIAGVSVPVPFLSKEEEASVLSEARRLLSEGGIALARERLLANSPGQRAEFALLLAQSYDPNYLRTLPKANGLADRAEATRWYKTWYEIAARDGLEMDNARFQRIINSMR